MPASTKSRLVLIVMPDLIGHLLKFTKKIYILDMANESNDIKNLDLDALIGNMSSINSEDYWFTKVSNIEEHDETAEPKQNKTN